MAVKSRQRHAVMNAERRDEQIDGWQMQTLVTRPRCKGRCFPPKTRRSPKKRHGFEPAQEEGTLTPRCAAEEFKAHLLAKERVLGVDGGFRDLTGPFRSAFAEMVDPDAGVDYLSHGFFRSTSSKAS